MSDVQFNEAPAFEPAAMAAKTKHSGITITDRVIAWGFAKDEKGASQVLLGTFIFCVVMTGMAFFFLSPHHHGPSAADIARMKAEQFQPAP